MSRTLPAFVVVLLVASCAVSTDVEPDTTLSTTGESRSEAATTTSTPATTTTSTTLATTTSTTVDPFARPEWLGTRRLPLRPDGHGEVQPTPPELQDRRLESVDVLEPPADETFVWTIDPVPDDVVRRSSWSEECPVTLDDLAYVTLSHYGFDGELHTGEMIVNVSVAEDVVEVFRRLHDARFPIEQMRVITAAEIDAHPTGDLNDTTSFVCRPAVGSSSWSQHAYGLAIDVNPFHNPYVKGDLVLPELAISYVDRDNSRPGMIHEGDEVTKAFDAIGWGWGGRWSSLVDWMHFSRSGT